IPHTIAIFVLGAFIALSVRPVVVWLERYMQRALALAIVYAGLVGAIVVLALLIIPAVLAQVQALAVHSPQYFSAMREFVNRFEVTLRAHFGKAYLPAGYGDLQDYLTARLSAVVSDTLTSIPELLYQTVTGGIVVISGLVLSAFFLLRADKMSQQFYALFPARRRASARALAADVSHIFGGFVAGQTLLCFIVGVSIYVVTVLLHFHFALLLGLVSGVAYAVPFVGMLVAQLVAVVLAAPQGGAMIVWVSIFVFVIARIADTLLAPKVLSESVGVSPIVVMFAVFAGGELFGIPGLLLGIPAAALAKAVWNCFRVPAPAPSAPAAEPGRTGLTPGPSVPEPRPREA
ncbi:MAG: AI-2E family transporter, partial [Vulcanimicrobiaceae bacterium]